MTRYKYRLAPPGEQGNARVKIREVLDTLLPPRHYQRRPGPHQKRGPKPGSHWSQRDAPRNNTTGGRAQRLSHQADPTSKEHRRPPRPTPTPA